MYTVKYWEATKYNLIFDKRVNRTNLINAYIIFYFYKFLFSLSMLENKSLTLYYTNDKNMIFIKKSYFKGNRKWLYKAM